MISSVEIPGTGVVIPVLAVGSDAPLYVRHIDGLGPVDAAINTKGYDDIDGEYFVSSAIGKRNIVLKFGINDVDAALNTLYAWFKTKNAIRLQFNRLGTDSVQIDGIVETQPFDRFTQDPEVEISIICPSPNFFSPTSETIEGPVDYGKVSGEQTFVYNGNADAGIDFILDIGDTDLNGDIYVVHTHDAIGSRGFGVQGVSIPAARWYHLSTITGKKRVESMPVFGDPETINDMLGYMDLNSWWLTLFPGENRISVNTPGDANSRNWSVTYTELFGAI